LILKSNIVPDGVEWIEDITSTQIIAKGGINPWNKFLDGFRSIRVFGTRP